MKIKYFMSHGSPWTFLGHKKVNEISKKNNCELDIMPVNYGEIFPVSGGFLFIKGHYKDKNIDCKN